ncbi:MAG: MerR family transcriptional regulator [Prevotellaceae bacterium]|jgi:DNA-binding transcriptional MerR regulator|nr:MerR family transcriptional regulator [Prevotellaceae bacterium]
MPYKEPKIERLQYSIGEVAEMLGESVSAIRYWSDRFEGIINPVRNNKGRSNGDRMFTPKDLETLKIIYNLVRKQGMSLEGAKKRIIDNRDGESRNAEIVNRLENIKSELLGIKNLF